MKIKVPAHQTVEDMFVNPFISSGYVASFVSHKNIFSYTKMC